MSQDEAMSESPVETLEKAVGLRLIMRAEISGLGLAPSPRLSTP